ncbi:MAG: hypothetical protein NC114_06310 [Ruminococcus flavefaciens]|nr:hypothetical protein [Ruminococcus flavefaciens]
MSKRKGGGGDFKNRAAKRFKDMSKVDLMAQDEVFDILDSDIGEMLEQVTAHREHRGPFPTYIGNAFANLSTSVWFSEYIKNHVRVKKDHLKTDLTKSQVESLKSILADAYRKSCSSAYTNQSQEYTERNALITSAFIMLSPDTYRASKKLDGLTKSNRQELTIQVYGDPVHNFKYIHRIINKSTVSDKKKIKYLKSVYGKRFTAMVGAAMTTEGNNSDCLAMIFELIQKTKKKKRGKYIRAYAEAYKKNNPGRYFRMDKSFYDENKKLIKLLIGKKKHPERAIDAGYRKAFADMMEGKPAVSKKKDQGKKWS